MNVLTMSIRNISRNRRRSILSGLSIVVSAAGIVFLFGFRAGFRDNISENVHNFVSGELRIRNEEFDLYEQLSPLHLAINDADRIRQEVVELPAIKSAVVRIPFGGVYFRDESTFNLQLLGVDFAEEERYLQISELLVEGRLPTENSNETVVGYEFLERFDLALGDQVTVLATTFRRGSNAFTVQIVGIVDLPYASLARTTAMIPLARARHYLRAGDSATEILLKLNKGYGYQAVKEEIASFYGGQPLITKHWSEIGSSAAILRTAEVSYIVIALIFFVLASTVIVNTTMMVIYERIQEIGMLGAIGMSSKNIVILFYLEALCIGIISTLSGIVVGVAINGYLAYNGLDLSRNLSGVDIQASTIIYPRTTINTVVSVFFYALVVSGITTLIPSLRASKIEPVEALREE